MSSIEFEGKNVDKAVRKASEELNLTVDEIEYEVISRGSTGIFGLAGTRKAKILVRLPEKEQNFTDEVELEEPKAEISTGEISSQESSFYDQNGDNK